MMIFLLYYGRELSVTRRADQANCAAVPERVTILDDDLLVLYFTFVSDMYACYCNTDPHLPLALP